MTIDWSWIGDHTDDLTSLTLSHLQAAMTAVFFGVLISLPLAVVAHRVRPLRTLLTVEFPLALPVIMAGVRIATVMSISLVSVATYIGDGGLGQLFTDGFQRNFPTPVIVGVVLTILLAVVADALLVALQYVLTPWRRRRA